MPKVSVIIPCYNQGQYVDEAVDSILNQTFQDFEIIVMNDGSTDPFTIEKLKSYNKPKTTVMHTPNQGLPKTRNAGIRAGTGEYVLPLDADDYMGATFLEKAVPVLDAQPEVGVVACGIQYFGTSQKQHLPKGGGVTSFLMRNDIGVPSLFRRVCWEQTGGYDESLKQGYQDWNFWIDITKRGWLVHVIPEYLYFYRRTDCSMVTTSNLMRPELVKHIVQNHCDVYGQYVVDVIYEKERKILELKQERQQLQRSASYKIGQRLTTPYRWLQRIIKGY